LPIFMWSMILSGISWINAEDMGNVNIKSYIKNDTILSITIECPKKYNQKEVVICNGDKTLYSSNFTKISGTSTVISAEIPYPVRSLKYEPLKVYISSALAGTIDYLKLPYEYVNAKPLRYIKNIREFEKQDAINPPEEGLILFLGSSSITRWKSVYADMSPLKVLNRGFGGSRSDDLLQYFNRVVLPYNPKTIVYYEGDNDIGGGKTPEQLLNNFNEFVNLTRKHIPGCSKIFFVSIKPSPVREKTWLNSQKANQLILEYTKTTVDVEFIDITAVMFDKNGKLRTDIFAKDNLHMNEKGYELWASIIKQRLLGLNK